jgi:putative membrane protein
LSGLLLRLIINVAAIFVAAQLIDNISYTDWLSLGLAALVLGLVNAVIRPIAIVLTLPLNIITLGLFTLVINALMLLLTSWLAGLLGIGFHVEGFWGAFWGALIISLVSWALSRFIR